MPLKGQEMTAEHKKKISEKLKGNKNNLGNKRTEETRRKMSASLKGKRCIPIGYRPSEETKRKIGNANKASKKGKCLTDEHKEAIRQAHKGKHAGEKSNFWRGGVWNNITYQKGRMAMHKAKRRALELKAQGSFILKQWNELKNKYFHSCLLCGRREPDIQLTPDHIIPLSRGGTNEISNIQPLCLICNLSKGNRSVVDYRKNFPKGEI